MEGYREILCVAEGSATPHEVKLVEKNLANRLIDELPEVLIGDKAYDSDEPDQK